MAPPPDTTAVQAARVAADAARAAQLAALFAQQNAKATLDAVQRSADPTISEGAAAIAAAQLDLQNKTTALAAARAALATARQGTATAIAAWQGGLTPQADVGRLDARSPIVFFPVRLETRFDRSVSPAILKVRIYPDEIFLNSHETLLTQEEIDAANAFYGDLANHPNDVTPEIVPWATIVQKMSPERASYVLRVGQGATAGAIDTWTRPGEAVLPDYWVIITYRNGQATTYVTNPVPEPLQLTLDPTHTPADQVAVPGSNGLQNIDGGIAWTVDYARAEALGMAKTIQLTSDQAADGTGGFDKILVFGVKTSMSALDTSTYLEKLFDAHHYTGGFAVLPQGTPTNNTEARPTPYPRQDGGGVQALVEERGLNGGTDLFTSDHALVTTRGNADFSSQAVSDVKALAYLLGVPDGVVPNVVTDIPGSSDSQLDGGGHEQARALSMSRALWPALFGSYIQTLVRGSFPAIDHDGARSYFVNWVRARGPAPAFRVGEVPYGVLPVISSANWAVRGTSAHEQLEAKIIPSLRRLRDLWLRSSLSVTRVGPGSTDPLGDLLKVLALSPSAREVRVRNVLGPATLFNLCQFAALDYQTVANQIAQAVAGVFAAVGQPAWASSPLAEAMNDRLASRVVADFVVPGAQLAEDSFLGNTAQNYFASLGTLGLNAAPLPNVATLMADQATFGGISNTLLYRLVRHSLLLEIARLAAIEVGTAIFPRLPDLEIIGIGNGTAAVPTYAQLLANNQLHTPTLGDFIFQQRCSDIRAAFSTLGAASTAELDRLCGETLDLASHRLDAWLTALATRRVMELRTAEVTASGKPAGTYLGGYGFVENVRPVTATVQNRPGVGAVEIQPANGGFIEAPSLGQATAAAILRGGSLAYRAEDPQKYAVDLSSARVRGARQVLDELRAGQPLGSALGQRFEQRLKDGYPVALGLDAYRYALRRRFPLVAGKTVPLVAGESIDGAAARNVVDGIALATAFRAGTIPFGTASDLPSPTPLTQASAYTAIVTEIGALQDAIDGVSDLVVSEAVLQISRGNTNTTLGNLDALARGGRPPESEMARSARTGVGLTQRVALVFPDGASPPSAGWIVGPNGLSPRAVAEPVIDAWVAGVLGDPTKVACTVTLSGPGGTTTKSVKLSDLGFAPSAGAPLTPLRPLDVLSLGRTLNVQNQGSLLDRWIAAAALRGQTGLTVSSIGYAPPTGARSLPEVLEIAATVGDLIGGARPLVANDIAVPAEAPNVDPTLAAAGAQDLKARALNALSALQVARDPLASATTSDGIRAGLEGVSPFILTAFPVPGASDADLATTRDDVLAEVNLRVQAASAVTLPADTATAALIDAATQMLRALFGDEFVGLSSFPLPLSTATEIGNSISARATLVGTTAPDPVRQVLQSAAQVQPGLARWRLLDLYLGVTGAPRPRLDVAQFPYVAGDRWVALPFQGTPAARGRVSMVIMSSGPAAPSTSVAWRGLLIDQWVEQIPNPSEDAGVAFHFDQPLAEAPQTVLVAAPSSTGANWSYVDVVATLNETLDLAKIRSVDRELVDGIGQVLPTSYLAQDAARNTVSTSWANLIQQAVTG